MLLKYYTDHYNLDQVYKFIISKPKKMQDTGEEHTTITLYFPNLYKTGSQEIVSFSSVKDKDTYDRVVEYLLNREVIEYNNVSQFFD